MNINNKPIAKANGERLHVFYRGVPDLLIFLEWRWNWYDRRGVNPMVKDNQWEDIELPQSLPSSTPAAGEQGKEFLLSEVQQLRAWKKEQTYLMEQLDLQAIGKELGIGLGQTITDKILPAIKAFKRREEEKGAAQKCMYCEAEFIGDEPKYCCSGKDCGCMGQPIDPVVCSKGCYEMLMSRYKQPPLPAADVWKHSFITDKATADIFNQSATAGDAYTPVVAIRDNDGHWYVIPKEMKDEFRFMEDDGEDDEWVKFNSKFSRYRTGGDLNNIQLFTQSATSGK